MFILDDVSCGVGNGTITIDSMIPKLVSSIVNIFWIAIPVILIVLGMLDLGKAVISNDEKEMKGAQSKLIKRLIYAALVFFIVPIVKFVFSTINSSGAGDYTGCIDCFISGPESESCQAQAKK